MIAQGDSIEQLTADICALRDEPVPRFVSMFPYRKRLAALYRRSGKPYDQCVEWLAGALQGWALTGCRCARCKGVMTIPGRSDEFDRRPGAYYWCSTCVKEILHSIEIVPTTSRRRVC